MVLLVKYVKGGIMKSKDNFTSYFRFSDKFLHMMFGFSAFVFLGFYTQWAFSKVFIIVMIVGILFEVVQDLFKKFFDKMDKFSGRDVVADGIGALLAMVWVNNPKNLLVFVALLGLYLWFEGIPRLRGQR